MVDDETADRAACLADMRHAASVPGLRDELMEHNHELPPYVHVVQHCHQRQADAITARLGGLIDAGFIEFECAFHPGVTGTSLCDIVQVGLHQLIGEPDSPPDS